MSQLPFVDDRGKRAKEGWLRGVFLLLGLIIGVVTALLFDLGNGQGDQAGRDEDSRWRNQRIAHGSEPARSGRAKSPGKGAASSASHRRSVASDQLPEVLYDGLKEADPYARNLAVMEILENMDSSNWRDTYLQFARITADTGRTHWHEWNVALIRTGQLAGSEAVEMHLDPEARNTGYAWTALYGWAQVNPNASMNWLNAQAKNDPALKQSLLDAVLAGQALTNSDLAQQTMRDLSPEERSACVGHFTFNLIQNEGMSGAIDWLVDVHETYQTDDPNYSSRVSQEVLSKMASAASSRQGVPALTGHLETLNRSMSVEQDQMMTVLGHLSVDESMELLQAMKARPAFSHLTKEGALARTVAAAVNRRDANSLKSWLEAHPDSPLAADFEPILSSQR